MSSTVTNIGLAALLSTTVSALVPRQAPPNPTTCFNLEAMAEGQAFNGEFVYIMPNPAQNYTTGLQASRDQGTIFILTELINGTAGSLLAVNAPDTPAKSVPLVPVDQVSAPIAWFNTADAVASVGTSGLRCETNATTSYLRCTGVEQFDVCTGSIYATRGAEVPSGCQRVDLMVVPTDCPAPPSSDMPMNNTMTSSSMLSTSVPFSNTTATGTDSSMVPTNTLTPLRPTAPSTIGNWNLLGCANSPSGFLGWVQVASTPIMTDEYCTVSCTNCGNCYCAVELEDVSTTTYPDLYTVPCPGNPLQACAGAVPRNGTFPRKQHCFCGCEASA